MLFEFINSKNQNINEHLKLIGLSIQVPTTWLQNACVPWRSVHLCTLCLAWSTGLYVAPFGSSLELEDVICGWSYPKQMQIVENHSRLNLHWKDLEGTRFWKTHHQPSIYRIRCFISVDISTTCKGPEGWWRGHAGEASVYCPVEKSPGR